MKKVFQKNQFIITALALMIAVAGYVSYTRGNLDNSAAQEASAGITEDSYEISDDTILEGDIFTDTDDSGLEVSAATETTDMDVAMEDGTDALKAAEATQVGENPGEAVLTSSNVTNVDFAAEMKLAREQVRAKNKETLLGIVNSTTLTDEQKQSAVDEMIALTDVAEREAAAEMLLEAKGFTDVVVSITEEAVDVVLNMGDVTDAKRAQVEDIVKRKTNISAENIIITPIETSAQDGASATESETQTESGSTEGQTDTQTQAPAGSETTETTETTETMETGMEM